MISHLDISQPNQPDHPLLELYHRCAQVHGITHQEQVGRWVCWVIWEMKIYFLVLQIASIDKNLPKASWRGWSGSHSPTKPCPWYHYHRGWFASIASIRVWVYNLNCFSIIKMDKFYGTDSVYLYTFLIMLQFWQFKGGPRRLSWGWLWWLRPLCSTGVILLTYILKPGDQVSAIFLEFFAKS